MEVRRIAAKDGLVREIKDIRRRIGAQETKASGNIVIRETLTTTDPDNGVTTIIGELPDGTYGIQPFVYDITPPPVATAPTVVAEPGLFVISWDGTFVDGEVAPRDFEFVNIIGHKMDGATTVLSTPVGLIRRPLDIVYVSQDQCAIGETWQFSLEAEDYNGNRAEWGARSLSVTMQSIVSDAGVNEALEALSEATEAANLAASTAQGAANTAQQAADEAAQAASEAAGIASNKNKVHYNPAQPSSTGNTVGDMWVDIDDSYTLYSWSGSAWVKTQDSQEAIDLAATKIRSFVQGTQPTATSVGDIWMDTSNKNELSRWSGSAWVSYRDLSIADADAKAATAIANAATAKDIADGKVTTHFQTGEPTGKVAGDAGDLWFDTDDGNKMYRWTGSAWVVADDQRIAAAITAAANAKTIADSKITTLYQDAEPTATGRTAGDLWVDTNDSNKLYRWNGSVWQSARDLTIASASNAAAAALEAAQAAQDAAESAQAVADGSIRTYYQADAPAGLNNSTDIGDLWFDTDDNQAYRWSGTTWVLIQDNAIAVALEAAQNAQTTADGKITSYYQPGQPAAGEVGDLWFDTDDKNKPYYCSSTSPLTWTQVRDGAIADAQSTANTALTSANGKNKTYYQTAKPSGGTYVTGDTWVDTDDGNKLYVYNGSDFVSAQDGAIGAAATLAASKGKTLIQSNTPAVADQLVQNLWIDTTNGANTPKRWNGSIWVAITDKAATDAAAAAVTAQSRADEAFNTATTAATAAGTAQTTADSKNRVWYLSATPAGTAHRSGDLWFDTDDGNKPYVWDAVGTQWLSARDATIAEAKAIADAAYSTSNGKNTTYYQPGQPTGGTYILGDLWFETDNNYKLYTYTGSIWQATQDAAAAKAEAIAAASTDATTKANNARQAAIDAAALDATAKAEQAEAAAAATAAADATAKADQARADAIAAAQTYADQEAAGASAETLEAAKADATAKANAARQAAIDAAALDATAKAEQAEADAAATAALDATAKANQAKADAIAAAATDATNKVATKNKTYYEASQPTGGTYLKGDLWFNTANNYKLYTYTGSIWQATQDAAAAKSEAIAAASTDAATKIATAKQEAIDAAALAAQAEIDKVWAAARSYVNPLTSAEGITVVSGVAPTVVDSATAMGGKALRKAGTGSGWYADTNGKQAFDPSALYRLTVRVRVVTASSNGAGGSLYTGVQGYAADGTTLVNGTGLNSTSSQHYIHSEVFTPTDGTWKEFVGYFKGNSTTNVSGGNTALDPKKLHANVRYFEPIVILDFNGGNGVWEVSHWAVDVVDATGHQAIVDANKAKVDAIAAAALDATAKTDAALSAMMAKGTNMVLNGSAELGDLTAWASPNVLAPGQTPSGYPGAFSTGSNGGTSFFQTSKGYITVNPAKQYRMSALIKSGAGARHFLAINQFDVDGNVIGYQNSNRTAGSETTLAVALNPGDTTVTLTDASAWVMGTHSWVGAFPFTTAAGTVYTINEGYTRTIGALHIDNTYPTKSGNVITLPMAYAGPAMPAGQQVAQMRAGSGYLYPESRVVATSGWETFSGTTTPGISSGIHPNEGMRLRPGTAKIAVGFLMNYGSLVNAPTYFTGVSLFDESDIVAAAVDATTKADTAQRIAISAAGYSGNPSFEDWTGTLPVGFGVWNTPPTKETATVHTGKIAARFNCTDTTTQRGMTFASNLSHAPNLEYYTIELIVRLVSGSSFGGSGVLLDWTGLSNNRVTLSLSSEIPTPTVGKWYKITKVVQRPTNATGVWTSMSGFLMGQYGTGLGTQAVKDIIFDWFNVRPATAEEITAYGTPASITSLTNVVNVKTRTHFQPSAPSLVGNTTGDIWIDTDDNNKPHVWNGAWTSARDLTIATAQQTADNAATSANGKNKVVYSTSDATGTTGYIAGDTWFKRDASGVIIAQWEFVSGAWASRTVGEAVIGNLTAGKIVAGEFHADRFNAETIRSKVIAATDINAVDIIAQNSITSASGVFGEVNANVLTAGTIATARLDAESIRSKLIEADYIAATDIFAQNSITSASGIFGTMDASVINAGTIGADRLNANDIRAKLIAADYLQATDIFAQNSITSASGIFGTMDASVLNAGTIAAARLDAETIKAKLIDASLINAVDILATGSITATNGIIGSIDASKITVNEMSGSRIVAKSILANRLVLSSTDNLLMEADFSNNGTSWGLGTNVTVNATAGRGSLPALRFTGSTAALTSLNLVNKIPVGTEDRFRGSMWVKSSVDLAADKVQLRLRCYTTATVYTDVVVATNQTAPFTDNIITAGVWTNLDGFSPVLPAGTVAVEFLIAVQNNATGTITDVDYVSVTRAADANLVVDGAIDGKIITGALIRTAAAGARLQLDSAGLMGWDANGVNYLKADSTGLSVTGVLKAIGTGYDAGLAQGWQGNTPPPVPIEMAVGAAVGRVGFDEGITPAQGYPLPGFGFKPINTEMYEYAQVTSQDGRSLTLQAGTTMDEYQNYILDWGGPAPPFYPGKLYLDATRAIINKPLNAPSYLVDGKPMTSAEVIAFTSSGAMGNRFVPVPRLGTMVIHTDLSTNSYMAYPSSDNPGCVFIYDAAVYNITFAYTQAGAVNARSFIEIQHGEDGPILGRIPLPNGEDTTICSATGVKLEAGAKLIFKVYQDSGASRSYNAVVRISKTAAPMPVSSWTTQTGNQSIGGTLTTTGAITSNSEFRAPYLSGGAPARTGVGAVARATNNTGVSFSTTTVMIHNITRTLRGGSWVRVWAHIHGQSNTNNCYVSYNLLANNVTFSTYTKPYAIGGFGETFEFGGMYYIPTDGSYEFRIHANVVVTSGTVTIPSSTTTNPYLSLSIEDLGSQF